MDTQILSIVVFLAGGALGSAVAWFLLRTKASSASAADLATLKERLEGKDAEVQRLQSTLNNEIAEHKHSREENVQLKAALEGERRAATERIASFKNATDELSEKFKALSRDALKDNNQSFLQLAHSTLEKFQQTAKGDLELKQKAIDELVRPLKESLERVDGKIGELEKARAGAYSELREQVKALATSQVQLQAETGNLVNALRAPHVRGRWGEIQLRRVVELAGMLQYCDFVEQETVITSDGRIRPDVIVRLPGNRTIVIDAKVPFDAFYESISTTDDVIRSARLKDHVAPRRSHRPRRPASFAAHAPARLYHDHDDTRPPGAKRRGAKAEIWPRLALSRQSFGGRSTLPRHRAGGRRIFRWLSPGARRASIDGGGHARGHAGGQTECHAW